MASGASEVHQGVIVNYFEDRGFGFIRPDQSSLSNGDVFLHVNHIKSGLPRVGARLEFDLSIRKERPAANNVVIF
jgi:cold shock CspA family protein